MAAPLTERIRQFRREFEARAMTFPGVEAVEFFGSITEPERFRHGSSDIDVAIYGEVPRDAKHDLRLLVRNLNAKYDLGLEEAPFLHPTPFFVEPGQERLFSVTGNGHITIKFDPAGRFLTAASSHYRSLFKDIELITYAEFWRIEERYLSRLPGYDRVFYTFW